MDIFCKFPQMPVAVFKETAYVLLAELSRFEQKKKKSDLDSDVYRDRVVSS